MFHELLVRTLLDNLPFIQYNDLIRVPNRFQSMGNHNDRFIFGKSFNLPPFPN